MVNYGSQHSPEEIALVITPYFPEFEHELLVNTVAQFKAIDAWPITPVISEEGFARLQEVMLEAGELHRTVDFSEVMDTKIATKAMDL